MTPGRDDSAKSPRLNMGKQRSPQGVVGNLTSYGDPEFSRFVHRSFFSSAGFDSEDFARPVVGIIDTSSDYTTCHRDMPSLVDAVKRGVLEAGGLPLVCPTLSLGETIISPTAMLYRNLLAMETEEAIRAYPMDAGVLVGGCDKTVPAQLMAAASANRPAVSVVTGPMRTGDWRGQRLGACTDCRGSWLRLRAGELEERELEEIERSLCPTGGTCMVMGTASTMACLTETLGLMLPGGATPPSGSADRLRNAVASGRCAARLASQPIRPLDVLTAPAFENALTVLIAMGGSTNAVIHLLALARRASLALTLDDFDRVSRQVPLLVNCKPAGSFCLEDMHRSGGVPALLKTLEPLLDTTTRSVTGQSLGRYLEQVEAPGDWQEVIHRLEQPLGPTGSLVMLKGSLAPNGAVIKAAAASMKRHRGPAVVFDSAEDAARRIDDPALGITPQHVLVLRNAGPAAAGMPEAGSLPIPRYLARKGVRDMLRVSDARMSGTAFGTVVLHCSPEAAAGGPLALVRDGDPIELNVPEGRIDLLVETSELEHRRAQFAPPPLPTRGWRRLHSEHVLPAHLGADLDFLSPEPSLHHDPAPE